MKFSDKQFRIDRKYGLELANKISVFEEVTKTKKTVQLAMICSAGLTPNPWSDELIAHEVTLDAFFEQ